MYKYVCEKCGKEFKSIGIDACPSCYGKIVTTYSREDYNSENENKDLWYYYDSLSKSDVEKYKKQGLIPSDIERVIAAAKIAESPRRESLLNSVGVKVSYVKSRHDRLDYNEDSFYITDIFLIRSIPNNDPANADLYFIPLENVVFIILDHTNNQSGVIKTQFSTKKGDPVKGAVIGGVVAGTTGAVVGAAISGKEKQIVTSPGGFYSIDSYSLKIKLKNGKEHIINEYCEQDIKKRSEIIKKNDETEKLIQKASRLSKNERQAIAKKVVDERQRFVNEEDRSGKFIVIGIGFLFIVAIIGFIVAIVIFCMI